ncbi:MAG: ABC transporter permease [Bacteroidia bacterium]|nr:ABC transporter permease [Bacteroidia bacterium]
MLKFILRRLTYGLLVLLGVVVVVFFLFNILPGDPARMMLGQRADIESIEAINKELGRDQPMYMQFLDYFNDLSPISIHNISDPNSRSHIDREKYDGRVKLFAIGESALVLKKPYLRRSYQTSQLVTSMISDALPGTAILAIFALLIAAIVGIGLGVLASVYKDTWTDNVALVFAVLGMSIPSFFAGIIVAWLFGYVLSDYTGLSMTGSLYEIDPFRGKVLCLQNMILPGLTLGIRPLSIITQLTRSSMLDVMSQDYIRTANAKGLSKYTVLVKHALRNALNPVITAISGWLGSLLAGALFVEYIFGWKGIGKMIVDALESYDFPVVMGAVLVVAGIFVIINILVDIIYGWLDPRVRVK